MAATPSPRVPPGRALSSSDADLDAASVITPEDLARAAATAPPPVRKYLEAAPDDAPAAPEPDAPDATP